MDDKTVLKVIHALIGETTPSGESETDKKRLENLKTLIEVTFCLIDEIEVLAEYEDYYEGSVRIIGQEAHAALNEWCAMIDAYLKYRKGLKWEQYGLLNRQET